MKAKLLIADDDIEIIESLQDLVFKRYEATFVGNGQEVIEALKKNNNYDLLVLDLMMPIMDGYTVLSQINIKDLPVLILSAKNSSVDRVKGYDLGAWGYSTKPFDNNVLLSQIDNLVKLGQFYRMESKRRIYSENRFADMKNKFQSMNEELKIIRNKMHQHQMTVREKSTTDTIIQLPEIQKSLLNLLDTQFKEIKLLLNFHLPGASEIGFDQQVDSILEIVNDLFESAESLEYYLNEGIN